MALSYKITLRDSGTPTHTVDLYLLKPPEVRPQVVINNTEYILYDGSRAIDYGEDKNMWTFTIEIEAGRIDDWTAANLTKVETLYALRTTQTIQLVENWKESGTVYTVHFFSFKKIGQSEAGTDTYAFVLKEA